MKWIVLFIIIVVPLSFPKLRIFLKKLPRYAVSFPKDVLLYVKHKKYNNAPIGFICGYVADGGEVFGSGKTLSAVKRLVGLFNKYDGLPVWSDELKKMVKQHVYIFSNITINCPGAVRIDCLQQYSDFIKECHSKDDKYISYLFIDEAGSEWNSRAFASNFTADFISDIVTCRHNGSAFIWTAQDITLVDKLLRSVTTFVYGCSHWGRVFFNMKYSAREVENVTDVRLVKPLAVSGYFASNKIFSKYDTYARFERMRRDVEEGKTLSTAQIIEQRECNPAYQYVSFRRKGKHFAKKYH